MQQIEQSVDICAPLDAVFSFVTDIHNHARVSPPESREELLDAGDFPLRRGTVVRLRARYGGIQWTLSSRITAYDPPGASQSDAAYFRDEQLRGPFAVWRHDHWFTALPDGRTRLTDRFTFAAPFWPVGLLAEHFWLKHRMRRLMEHMQATQKSVLEAVPRPAGEAEIGPG